MITPEMKDYILRYIVENEDIRIMIDCTTMASELNTTSVSIEKILNQFERLNLCKINKYRKCKLYKTVEFAARMRIIKTVKRNEALRKCSGRFLRVPRSLTGAVMNFLLPRALESRGAGNAQDQRKAKRRPAWAEGLRLMRGVLT